MLVYSVVYILAVCSDGCGKAQHVADDNCIIVVPEIITDATPCTIVQKLHSAFIHTLCAIYHQPNRYLSMIGYENNTFHYSVECD